jgi:hypothetical protein
VKAVARFCCLLTIVAVVALLPGCVPVGVHVWERDILAKQEMQSDNEVIDRSIDDHIYFSKEAASGGRGFGGGGCGCN